MVCGTVRRYLGKILKTQKEGKKKNQIKSKFVFVFLRECAEQTYSAIQNRKLDPV